jgi:hypothetical protein
MPPLVDLPRAKIVSGDCSGNDLGLVFGLAWIVGGVVWLAASGPAGPWGLPSWLCPAAAIWYGLSHVPGWWRRHVGPRRLLGASRSQLAPGIIRPGGRCAFRFTQQMRLALSAQVDLSFVLRETVVTGSGEDERTTQKDHLVQSYDAGKVRIEPGAQLELAQELDVPPDFGRRLRTGDWPVSWLVKIRIVTQRGAPLWQEIELPSCDDPASGSALASPVPEGFEVVLTRFRVLSISKLVAVIQSMTPHLTSSQASELLTLASTWEGEGLAKALTQSAPTAEAVVLAGGLSRSDAESARVRLEAAGATVEVRLRGVVIPPSPGRRLPIPHEDALSAEDSLPVPSSAEPGHE